MTTFELLDVAGSAAPPRSNGELVFDAPWQQRAFGITMAVIDSGTITWKDFRLQLISRIAEDDDRPYWESWAAALEDLLSSSALLTRAEIDSHENALAQREAGHDHRRSDAHA